jgi:ectoine hydroxylase-related dioxygenase (phytanoyl-CoA dioxygenase family)
MTDEERAGAWTRDGYLVIRDAIAPASLDPIRDMISERVDAVAKERHAAGELPSLFEQEPFGRRYAAMREHLPEADGKFFGPTELSTHALYDLYTHPAITDVLRVIVGPEVTMHGISVVRVKLPDNSVTAIPWHQDSHYYNEETAGTLAANTEHMHVVTAWAPLVDVEVDNGCLWFIPGSHRWGFLSGGRSKTGQVLIDGEVEERGTPTPVPMKTGDVVFFTNLTLHRSKVNSTDRVRWSHDFRYHQSAASTPGGSPTRASIDYFDTK